MVEPEVLEHKMLRILAASISRPVAQLGNVPLHLHMARIASTFPSNLHSPTATHTPHVVIHRRHHSNSQSPDASRFLIFSFRSLREACGTQEAVPFPRVLRCHKVAQVFRTNHDHDIHNACCLAMGLSVPALGEQNCMNCEACR